jgi:hypothetical protein
VIWALLVMVGVPLWLCALAVLTLVLRNRDLRRRHGNVPVRVLRPGKTRWTRGHAVWVSDVFAWRGSPAAWSEDLAQVVAVAVRESAPTERKPLHRLGDAHVVAVLSTAEGRTLTVAAAGEHRLTLSGPFAAQAAPPVPMPKPGRRSTPGSAVSSSGSAAVRAVGHKTMPGG